MDNIKRIEERLSNIEYMLLSQKTVFNFEEFVSYTGLSESYSYKLTSNGEVPCYKPKGKMLYFNRLEVDKWLLSNRKATKEDIEHKASTYLNSNRSGI